jgi:hypothetical protein
MRARNTLTFEQRQERRRKAKEKPAKNYYQLQKYAALAYDYGQIAEEHRELVQEAAVEIHRWQRNTIELGNTLLAVKEVLDHGQFLDWIKVEFEGGIRELQKSMHVARMLKDNPNAGNYPLLSASALYLLAAPSTPDVVRWEIQERIEMGDWRPTRRDIQRRIRAERQLEPKQLPGPVADPDSIEAEYTVVPAGDLVTLRHELRLKMIDGAAHKVFMPFLTRDEHDELFIALTRVLDE